MREGSKNVDLLECVCNLFDYWSKASKYSYVLTYFKTRVTTNQKHTIDSKNQNNNKKRNSSIIQKKTFKPQKEKQKAEERNEELQNQL